jgi:hypothetical protein
MDQGATEDVVWERDRALHRLQILAAEIRAHEEATGRSTVFPRRAADDRLYRRLRRVNGPRSDRAGSNAIKDKES